MLGFQTMGSDHCIQVGGHVFSLAEIEHCILRASMNKPRTGKHIYAISSSLISKVAGWLSALGRAIPKWQPDDLRNRYRVQHSDPRINFGLNSGTCSSPPHIMVMLTVSILFWD